MRTAFASPKPNSIRWNLVDMTGRSHRRQCQVVRRRITTTASIHNRPASRCQVRQFLDDLQRNRQFAAVGWSKMLECFRAATGRFSRSWSSIFKGRRRRRLPRPRTSRRTRKRAPCGRSSAIVSAASSMPATAGQVFGGARCRPSTPASSLVSRWFLATSAPPGGTRGADDNNSLPFPRATACHRPYGLRVVGRGRLPAGGRAAPRGSPAHLSGSACRCGWDRGEQPVAIHHRPFLVGDQFRHDLGTQLQPAIRGFMRKYVATSPSTLRSS